MSRSHIAPPLLALVFALSPTAASAGSLPARVARPTVPRSGDLRPPRIAPAVAVGRRSRVRAIPIAPVPTADTIKPTPTTDADGSGSVLFEDRFDLGDGLITNEYATWNPAGAQASPSPAWVVTSGSLFARDGAGWTGIPDGCPSSSPRSVPCTASDVFRLDTREHDFGDVTVSMELVNELLTSSSRTPRVAWDGVHIWLHHQSEFSLYYASVNRRDGHVVLKKKCPGGTENGGTYYVLADSPGHPIPFGAPQHVAARVDDEADGSVRLELYREGERLLSATDRGVGCAPIDAAGSVGVRGDNDEFEIDDFRVTQG